MTRLILICALAGILTVSPMSATTAYAEGSLSDIESENTEQNQWISDEPADLENYEELDSEDDETQEEEAN